VDAAGNACPSLHVATAMFNAACLEPLLRRVGAPASLRVANALWFVAIAYSTLAVKQHVAVDVAAGATLGLLFALASLRWRPRDGA
jgi:membrane-associated phospholipid phosphatase